ncbi:MAG: hypothetical protein V1257_07180 [Candidatus Neomarinimicrobiota bacterium]|jgi:hypothetical protein|uniref:Uncharacterized protein n=1 Tax=marine metagenome TaxID=408172 RepID=A0A381S533_9ZZZZ|nr:hypothetical protein [Candidatus Neomarinimicrobiota bacterium]MEE1573353.1 hypothetical protein [Candidatus Neomarinimicrobiota bacterium]|tara:strand:- start:631 stop:918 length:288 start_codon:yes stop_codon:yes gene_type:complete
MSSIETDLKLSWSGVSTSVTQEWLEEFKVAVEMQKSKAFREYRVSRIIELSQRQLDELEANKDSDDFMQTLAWNIGELYCWQQDGEIIEPPVQAN